MKIKSILTYEKQTGESFFELSNRMSEGNQSMTDLVKMYWISKLDENPELKLDDAVSCDTDFEEFLKDVGTTLSKK